MPWARLYTYRDVASASTAVAALQAAGIEARVPNAASSSALWHLNVAMGGVHVEVRDDMLDEARRTLRPPGDDDDDDDWVNEVFGPEGTAASHDANDQGSAHSSADVVQSATIYSVAPRDAGAIDVLERDIDRARRIALAGWLQFAFAPLAFWVLFTAVEHYRSPGAREAGRRVAVAWATALAAILALAQIALVGLLVYQLVDR